MCKSAAVWGRKEGDEKVPSVIVYPTPSWRAQFGARYCSETRLSYPLPPRPVTDVDFACAKRRQHGGSSWSLYVSDSLV